MLISYLQRKIEKLFLIYREKVLDGVECSLLQQTLVKLFPFIHLAWQSLDLGRKEKVYTTIKIFLFAGFLLLFALHKSKFSGLMSYLCGYQLYNVSADREREKSLAFETSWNRSTGVSKLVAGTLLSFAKLATISLETGSFFLQFLGE